MDRFVSFRLERTTTSPSLSSVAELEAGCFGLSSVAVSVQWVSERAREGDRDMRFATEVWP